MRFLPIVLLCLSLTGCALTDYFTRQGDAAMDLLVLRATYQLPAEQAGVLELAEEQANRLDEALASQDIERVRAVLRDMKPIYDRIYEQVEDPTPEQLEFHERAASLWDYLDSDNSDLLRTAAIEVLLEIARRVP